MRKFLLAATMMVPLAAFANSSTSTIGIAGDVNLATTSAGSTAGVQSTQGTQAQVKLGGTGAVTVGTVSGNYTSVQTTAAGRASPAGSYTNTTATQTNVGGTNSSGIVINKGFPATSGSSSGGQSSQATGGSTASASNTNLGGSVIVRLPQQGRNGRGPR